MKEELISYNTALLAKERNFKEKCLNCYYHGGQLSTWQEAIEQDLPIEADFNSLHQPDEIECSAPPQSFLQKFLREKHNIHIEIQTTGDEFDFPKFIHCIYQNPQDKIDWQIKQLESSYNQSIKNSFDTYEECLENSLQQSLQLIKQ